MPESTPRTTLVTRLVTTKQALREHRAAMDGTVAAVLTMVVGRILPTSAEERRVFGTDPVSADVHSEEGESR